ncbi:UDP-glucose/GDP-mannose dehydrogenase family protein [Neobacillus sp. OS1-2]|uniref:UDP-glucose dehydrogenase family protein n=1 Tax=Neobacillus sp. OS1-2 TaxID=3070680 RepID=UPI0027E1008D|nr:UDP-glucose/GDP-mannose dehydrogenase family protein [Neobacillus sp. OS1-2]WML41216.1 UDP-glucose/GDP-mannose dehydrogenase family protein [Neobacillus sp. OS1-2]
MKITITGTGYVGLVTGTCLAEIGHQITCFDIDKEKISLLNEGISPIYEPGLGELIQRNIDSGRLTFSSNPVEAYSNAECIFIAVGTPANEDGSANLSFLEAAAIQIAEQIKKDIIVVIKSTVPVGTNERIGSIIQERVPPNIKIEMVSNPEFLREGTAIHDTFHGDRIVIGANTEEAGKQIGNIYEPLHLPIVHTDIRSAEMIKYASNSFLALKISFINEIANLCEKIGADIDQVSAGVGLDNRIGKKFLNAGIGFGGSCFPKDIHALNYLAKEFDYDFKILQSVIDVNYRQKDLLFYKAKEHFGSLAGKRTTILGLTFKPNTDDIREAASLRIIQDLLLEGAVVTVFDPVAMPKVEKLFGDKISFAVSSEQALVDAEAAFILTEWDEIKSIKLKEIKDKMTEPIIFDGRNCFSLEETKKYGIRYYSIGRPVVQ